MSGDTQTRPVEASDTVTILETGGKTIYLVGTAHVSADSVDEVERIIRDVQPDTVCVELDPVRYAALTDESRWKNLDIFKVIKEGKTLFLLANLAIGAYQRRLGAELGVKPGTELLAGAKMAEEVGANLELIDRDIKVTLRRTWSSLGFWRKMTLLGSIIDALVSRGEVEKVDVEQLKQKAHLSEMMAEFSRVLPEVHRPLIDERDRYMMSGIEDSEGTVIVAVVGAGHVPGMVGYFEQPQDRAELDKMPPPSLWSRGLKWLIPMLILAAFSIGYYRNDFGTVKEMLFAWVLPNSVFCAALTAVALAKPLSVVAAFIASPITSLNPLLPAGVVVGLVEAWLRRPTVEDMERINDDVQSLKGIYRNQFTRVLLVAVMATIGSALGAWIGLGWVFSMLG